MTDPLDISAGLPAPRNDEPANLRQDIADELADHLRCAVGRERLLDESVSGGESAALRGALARFGDPAAVARRLWWDAMKEKIMAQRLMSVLAVLASAACVLCALFMWQLVQSNRASQESLLAAQHEMLATIMANLKQPPAGAAATESELWQPLRVKLVDSDNHAVAGIVTCSGKSFGTGNDIYQREPTDAQGIADFGRLPTGQYTVTVAVDSTNEYSSGTSILLGPGRPSERTIECPTKLPDAVTVQFAIEPPAELQSEPLYYVVWLSPRGRSYADQTWHTANEGQDRGDRYVLLDHTAKVVSELLTDEAIRRESSGPATTLVNVAAIPAELAPRPCAGLIPRTYHLMSLAAYLPANDVDAKDGARPALTLVNWQVPQQSVNFVINASNGDVSEVININFAAASFWDSIKKRVSGRDLP